jgi:Asp-tRNA(Asn)/Glu-tRNA(Gln) amidotransferase A subunit family amidase
MMSRWRFDIATAGSHRSPFAPIDSYQTQTIGITVDGPANSDRELLAIALAMEQVLGRAPAPK